MAEGSGGRGGRRLARAAATGVGVAVLGLAGCRSSGAGESRTSDPPIAIATTTTAAGAFDPPATIDEAYVNGLLAELARIEGDAVRRLVASRDFSAEIIAVIRSLYLDDWFFEGKVLDLTEAMAGGFEGVREVPGDRSVVVNEIISARSDCIYVEVERNNSPLVVERLPSTINWIALVPVPPEVNPSGRNPTGWGYAYYGYQEGGGTPPDPCGL